MNPLITAVIPVHNGEQYLADAIRSVLGQTHEPVECIVVDDGSTDGTGSVAREFGSKVRYERQENAGVSAARNRGALLANGEYLGFLDHDDVWLARRCERELAALESSEAPMALCAVTEVDAELHEIGQRHLRAPNDLLEGMVTFDQTTITSCSSAALVSRRSFFELGGFDESLGMSADWDFLARNLLAGAVEYVDEPLVFYRRHAENWSAWGIDSMEKDMLLAFDKVFSHPDLPPGIRSKRRKAYARLYRMLAGSYLDVGKRIAAVRSLAASFRWHPAIACEVPGALRRRLTSRPKAGPARAR